MAFIAKKKYPFYVAFAFLCVLSFLFFFNILLSGKSLFGHDIVAYFYPLKKYIYEYLTTNHKIPLWNPCQFSGSPFISNIQLSLCYPLGLIYFVLSPEWAYLYSTILHCVLGGLFMYFLSNSLGVTPAGCLASSIVFSYNGYFLGHLYAGHLTFIQNYIWIPLIFFFLFKFKSSLDYKYAVISGLILGIQILGGFPQIGFYTIFAIILYIAFAIYFSFRDKHPKFIPRLLFGLFIILFFGFSLSAIQILPTYEFSRLSTRGNGISYEFAVYDSLHPKELLAFFLPDIFGNPVDHTYWRRDESWHFWETCGYVGILPLLFLFIKTESRKFRRLKMYFLFLTATAVFLSLGQYNPIYPLIYKFPGFDRFRIPAQIIFLYAFGISTIAGIGLHHMKTTAFRLNAGFYPISCLASVLFLLFLVGFFIFPNSFCKTLISFFSTGPLKLPDAGRLFDRISSCIVMGNVMFFVSVLLVMTKKYGSISWPWFRNLAVGIIFLDLYLFGSPFVKSYDYSLSAEKLKTASLLPVNPAQGRVLTQNCIFLPNDPTLFGFPSILGYDPFILKRYVHYVQYSQSIPFNDHVVNLTGIQSPDAKLLKLLNTKYYLTGFNAFRLPNEYGYSVLADRIEYKNAEEALAFMNTDLFDPNRMVILERGTGVPFKFQAHESPVPGRVEVVDYKNDMIVLRATADRHCCLVSSEIYYPGWEAEIDGEPARIERGNYLFRSVFLTPGTHEIRFHYRPVFFKIGTIWSLATITFSLFWVFRKPRQRCNDNTSFL